MSWDTPYPEDTVEDTGGILGKPRYPENTSGVLGIPYPQDTDGILRIPRCPEDTAGVLRCLNREIDAPVSLGHRILRMPSVSHDADLHFQTLHFTSDPVRPDRVWSSVASDTVNSKVRCTRNTSRGGERRQMIYEHADSGTTRISFENV